MAVVHSFDFSVFYYILKKLLQLIFHNVSSEASYIYFL